MALRQSRFLTPATEFQFKFWEIVIMRLNGWKHVLILGLWILIVQCGQAYAQVDSISSISPTSGPVGSAVVITGLNFGASQGSSTVSLNGTNAVVTVWTDTSITAIVPSGASSGPLSVVVNQEPATSVTFTITPLPSGWSDTDVGSVGVAGSASYANGKFTVTGAGQFIGTSSADQMHFAYQSLSGDGTIVARVVSVGGTSTNKGGVMIRETLNPGATTVFADFEAASYSYSYCYYRATTGTAGTSNLLAAGATAPYWLKLVRSGSTFSEYTSTDGVNWTESGTTETITMAQNVYIGLAVNSGSNSATATAVFDNVSISSTANPAPVITGVSATSGSVGNQVTISGSGFGASQGGSLVFLSDALVTVNSWSATTIGITIPTGATSGPLVVSVTPNMNDSNAVDFSVTTQPLPDSWLNQDIGPVGIAGSATYASGVFSVTGAGRGIAANSDQLQFVYQPLSGDGTIVARVASTQGTNPTAGVMIRETLNPGATMAYAEYYNKYDSYFYYRTSTGAASSYQPGTYGGLPYWVKLTRSGNTFSAYVSSDGVNWIQIASSVTINMAENVYIGLAVTSGSNTASVSATFDNVSITTTSNPAPVITAVSSTTGSVGNEIAIAGSGFGAVQGSSLVTLNGSLVTINSWGASGIIITLPTGATSGPLVVTVAPTMNDSNPVVFTVTSQPLPIGVSDQDMSSASNGTFGTVTGSASYANGVYTVSGSGQWIYGSTDGMHFAYQPLSGDGSIVARVLSLSGGSSSAQAAVMIRETLGATSTDAFMGYQGHYIYLWDRPTTGASTAYQSTNVYLSLPYWMKVVRSGTTFSGYASSDGVNWVQVGSSVTISMAQNVYIGLAVSSDSSSSLTTVKFDSVSISSTASPAPIITNVSSTTGSAGTEIAITGSGFGASQGSSLVMLNDTAVTINSWSAASILVTLPSGATSGPLVVSVAPTMNDSNAIDFTVTSQALPTPWLDQDVGQVGAPGSATYASGVFTVSATGLGSSQADEAHFVYQLMSTDATIVARVVSLSSTSGAQAFAMIRETLSSGATDAYVGYEGHYIYFWDRSTTGGSNSSQYSATYLSLPYWVKLVRSGSTFASYSSADGVNWVQVGTTVTISMSENYDIGLGVISASNSTAATATFDNVSVTIGTTPFVTGLSPVFGNIGATVTVTGSHFGATQGSSTCSFNGTVASSITSWIDTQIVAVVPAGASTGSVSVTVNSIPSLANPTFTVVHPVINSLVPPAAQVGGQVVLNGSGFGANQVASTVSINGVSAPVASWSDTSIMVTIESGMSSGPVTVLEDGSVSNAAQLTLLEGLSVTGVSPPSGLVGSTVTITGTGFGPGQSDSATTFDGVPATVTSWTDTSITAVVPPGASTGPVTVEVANSTALGPTFTLTGSVQLTDSLSHQSTYASQLAGGKWYVSNSQGSGCSSCTVRGNIQNQYDNSGNITQTTDELGNVTSYAYYNNKPILITQPAVNGTNPKTSYTYNNFGEPLTVTDPLGNITTNTYDAHGNLLTAATPAPNGDTAASVTQFAYNLLGELTQITDPLGRITKLAYTSAGLIYTITDAQNNVTTYGYDSNGNRTSVTDAMNNQTTFAYDSWNRLLKITYPGNATMIFTYDYRGRRTSVTDQNSKKTTYAYDDADRLTSVTDPNNNVTQYTYDTENNLLSIEDANNHTTQFAYDAYGRVTETTFPSTHYEQFGYDAANNLTSKTDRNGKTIGYVYDDLYRLTQKNYPDSTNVEYAYDLVGKLQQVTDPTGTYGFAYDNMGRLVGTTTKYTFLPNTTYTNSYSYDAASNRVTMTDPQNGVTSYAYDTLNRLATLTPPTVFGSGSFGFSYDALSRRTQMTRPNGVTTNYSYNNLSRLLSVLHQVGARTIDGAAYTVDPVGNRTAKTNEYSNVTSNYTYDPLYELTQVMQTTNTTESYSYDPVGNRLSSLGLSPYDYNSSNELTSTPSASYTYDNNGNTLTKVTSAGTTTYAWDYENRLTGITLPGSGGTLAFKYDGLGHRVQKVFTQNSNTTTTNYLYDRNNALADVDQNGNIMACYTATQKVDEPLAELRLGATSYYQVDGLASVTSLSTAAGTLVNTYTYDSFGNLTGSTGSITNRFEYTAREFDSESGLYYYRARYYDPVAGRFLSEDPIAFPGGINFFRFVGNDPTSWRDPSGLQAQDPTLPPTPPAPPPPPGWDTTGHTGGTLDPKPRPPLGAGVCLLGTVFCHLIGQFYDPEISPYRICDYNCDDGTNINTIWPATSGGCPPLWLK
jgi:RHS repeat-associated protein